MDQWACELRDFDADRNLIGEPTLSTFGTYEQARAHAAAEVAKGKDRVGAVIFALRRATARPDSAFVPGEIRDQT